MESGIARRHDHWSPSAAPLLDMSTANSARTALGPSAGQVGVRPWLPIGATRSPTLPTGHNGHTRPQNRCLHDHEVCSERLEDGKHIDAEIKEITTEKIQESGKERRRRQNRHSQKTFRARTKIQKQKARDKRCDKWSLMLSRHRIWITYSTSRRLQALKRRASTKCSSSYSTCGVRRVFSLLSWTASTMPTIADDLQGGYSRAPVTG